MIQNTYNIIVNDDDGCDDNAPTRLLIDFAFVVGRDSCFTGSYTLYTNHTIIGSSVPMLYAYIWRECSLIASHCGG